MTLRIDPEIASAILALSGPEPAPRPPVGDIATRRTNIEAMFSAVSATWPRSERVDVEEHTLVTDDNTALPLRWYRPAAGSLPGSAVLYLHGGGMIFGLNVVAEFYDKLVRAYVAASGVPALIVDYRVAPENPDPTPVQDCYAALNWLAGHAKELGVDPGRIGVVGDSAGGGLAAGVALMARDLGGPAIALQLLIYPMLDDRTTDPDPQLPQETLVWDYNDNVTGWSALLGDSAGGAEVSPYAAAARASDVAGLPPTYLDTGDLDIFRDEITVYARRLAQAGVPTELHIYPGCPHGFEVVAPQSTQAQQAMAARIRRLQQL
ncbi:alpha/beta hydrolase [Mycolicibacterium mageritense DSM 44476 = CIP 104973]|uniref:Alpha/beta hydrolase n=1 Tax=Mycolicibacterium mageritense TaxID=53462 RepID=A0AAI8TQ77_MYCME|nr:alpha/beta hydrolase [Mycolicibacterium mageritense]MCC9180682.1 alpha/beta hydrolase [Mycolicibacterium mageritense]BBX32438.1 alpha/beta hydrolase [Mycolicibacterium mageritense]BDY28893.1 Carboxylesterase NlhH [Mycolicibacterium mageritense]CDO23021.1 lipase [Mycolicibacterium mageritense DSM 44476 = CIP 104973]